MDKYDKLSLLDGLKSVWFDKGDVIVTEGDIGDLFYIVEEGHVECLQKQRKNSQDYSDRVLRKLTSGDHFGELALINNEKRTLTVKCGSDQAKLLALDRKTFNRILGQIDKFLNRDYSDLVSFERADITTGWNCNQKVSENITANFTDIRHDNELQHSQWSQHSCDIREVLNDVDQTSLIEDPQTNA